MTLYPSLDEVLIAHARLIALFGGASGVRDRGALEAALARPRTGYYEDLIQEAAALFESLSQNHPAFDQATALFDQMFDYASEADRAKIRGLNAVKLFGAPWSRQPPAP